MMFQQVQAAMFAIEAKATAALEALVDEATAVETRLAESTDAEEQRLLRRRLTVLTDAVDNAEEIRRCAQAVAEVG